MKYRIERHDQVEFSAPVREHHLEVRVAPWDDAGQRLAQLEVLAEPAAVFASHRDGFGNQVHRTALLGAHDGLTVSLTAEVETLIANPFGFEVIPAAREPDWIGDSLRQAPRLWDFMLHRSALTPDLSAAGLEALRAEGRFPLALPEWRAGVQLLTQVQDAMAWIGTELTHDPEAQTPAAALLDALAETHKGGAADLAHLLVALVRGWGMPARFVTGYLDAAYFDADDEAEDQSPRPQTLHCWAEVLIPGGGWRGFDPALGLLADATYIRLAIGRDAADLTGLRQVFKGDGQLRAITTDIAVTRLD